MTVMPPSAPERDVQLHFDFGESHPSQGKTGLKMMREQVRAAWRDWAFRMGLPLNQEVEVVLHCGRSFRGILRPYDPSLFVPEKRDVNQVLEVGGVPSEFREIVSCVRVRE